MLLLLLLLTPNEVLKKTENRILLSISGELPPDTAAQDPTLQDSFSALSFFELPALLIRVLIPVEHSGQKSDSFTH